MIADAQNGLAEFGVEVNNISFQNQQLPTKLKLRDSTSFLKKLPNCDVEDGLQY